LKKITIHFTVNHEPVTVEVEPNHRLIDVLRNNLGLTSVKEGCSEGECGACTVIYNGEPVTSCCILAGQADGADIITLEGVSSDGQTIYTVSSDGTITSSPTWCSRRSWTPAPCSAASASPA
jgi:aerobic-type carbon monoxide dehydrogenase small subunit (CoxS/CutS family)